MTSREFRRQHEWDLIGETVSTHYLRRRAREAVQDLEREFPHRNYTVRTRRFRVPRYAVERIG